MIEIDTNNKSYRFKIIEIFKGNYNDSIISGEYFDSCSKFPKDKCKWIIYADFRENIIDISECLASRSEMNPVCTFCYKPPPPIANMREMKEYEREKDILKEKALRDWKNELVILREWKKK